MAKILTSERQIPNQIAKGQVNVDSSRLDSLVYQKGLDVIWESSVKCPCKQSGRGNLLTCVNCGGTGWIFVNPVKTRMVVSSLNQTTKYSQWSVERIGIANITCRAIDNVGDMDKITLTASISKMSQVIYPNLYKSTLFAFTNYPAVRVIDVFMFTSDDKQLVHLSPKDYSIDGNKIVFDKKLYTENMTVSVRYTYNAAYFVIDIPHEIRETLIVDAGTTKTAKLPISAVARRCHYIINGDKFEGRATVDNSYNNE